MVLVYGSLGITGFVERRQQEPSGPTNTTYSIMSLVSIITAMSPHRLSILGLTVKTNLLRISLSFGTMILLLLSSWQPDVMIVKHNRIITIILMLFSFGTVALMYPSCVSYGGSPSWI